MVTALPGVTEPDTVKKERSATLLSAGVSRATVGPSASSVMSRVCVVLFPALSVAATVTELAPEASATAVLNSGSRPVRSAPFTVSVAIPEASLASPMMLRTGLEVTTPEGSVERKRSGGIPSWATVRGCAAGMAAL